MPVTTYIFGAGASIHAGYPLARKMGESFLAWQRSQSDDTFLATYEKYFAGADFEQALNEMAQVSMKQDPSVDEGAVKVAFAYFGSKIRSWFAEIGIAEATAYMKFAKEIAKAGDRFMSFNYDICLDRALRAAGIWEVDDGYGFRVGDSNFSATRLIKLHGSINWTISLNSVSPDRPVIARQDRAALDSPTSFDPAMPEPFYEAGPLLSVPTTKKKFYVSTSLGPRFGDFWDYLWNLSREYLSKSDEIIICGYSLPLADERAREVIFSSIKKTARIEVVCGSTSSDIANEFR